MIEAVFDTNIFVSAFLTRHHPGGLSNELLRFIREGNVKVSVSSEIIAEILATLTRNPQTKIDYKYTDDMVEQFCSDLLDMTTIVSALPMRGAVPRDADDDKIIACAIKAKARYIVTRDQDLLSLSAYNAIKIIKPEDFMHVARAGK